MHVCIATEEVVVSVLDDERQQQMRGDDDDDDEVRGLLLHYCNTWVASGPPA